MKTNIMTLVATLIPSFAFASSTALSTDNSGIFVWAFLGFCALIVVAQVIPAVLLMTGIVKGLVSVVREETVAVKS